MPCSEHGQVFWILAATLQEQPPSGLSARRYEQALGPMIRPLEEPEPDQRHDRFLADNLIVRGVVRHAQLPPGRTTFRCHGQEVPGAVCPLGPAENEQANAPKSGTRPRRDQGPSDGFPILGEATDRCGSFSLSIRETLAVGPFHRSRDDAGRIHGEAILPVLTILGDDLPCGLPKADFADGVYPRAPDIFARQDADTRSRSL